MKLSTLFVISIFCFICNSFSAELQEEDIDNPNAQKTIPKPILDSTFFKTQALESTGATEPIVDTPTTQKIASPKVSLTDSIEIVNEEDAALQKYYKTRAKKTVITITNHEPSRTSVKSDGRSYGGIITGACLFGGSYTFAILLSLITNESDPTVATTCLIPCVGPLVAFLASPPQDNDLKSCFGIICAAWSAVETIGAVLVVKTVHHNATITQQHNPEVSFYPDISPGKFGLTMHMRFEPF